MKPVKKVPVVPPLSKKQIEAIVTSLLRKANPEALRGKMPVEIEKIYEFYIPENYGIETSYTDLSPLGFGILGYTDAASKKSFIDKTLIDSIDTVETRRCNATIGHEAGHCILHVPVLNIFRSSLLDDNEVKLYRMKQSEIKPFLDPEWQAWEFARACLMPRQLILECCNKGYSLRDMAEYFNLNQKFIKTRLRNLTS